MELVRTLKVKVQYNSVLKSQLMVGRRLEFSSKERVEAGLLWWGSFLAGQFFLSCRVISLAIWQLLDGMISTQRQPKTSSSRLIHHRSALLPHWFIGWSDTIGMLKQNLKERGKKITRTFHLCRFWDKILPELISGSDLKNPTRRG